MAHRRASPPVNGVMQPPSNKSKNTTKERFEDSIADAAQKLYPRLALYEALVGYRDVHRKRQPSPDHGHETRRNFLDSFAYLCDTMKGGDTVTAAAFQQQGKNCILWLVANEGTKPSVLTYAEKLLVQIKTVNNRNRKEIRDLVLDMVVEETKKRLNFNREQATTSAKSCMKILETHGEIAIVHNLRSSIKSFWNASTQMTTTQLVRHCYDLRKGQFMSDLNTRTSETPKNEFHHLSHLIGRLGATLSKIKEVMRTAMALPTLRKLESKIQIVYPRPPKTTILDQRDLSPYEIVKSICQESSSKIVVEKAVLHSIVEIDLQQTTDDKPFRERLNAHCNGKIRTRVHAELQLANHFVRSPNMQFYGDDQYVGCSKPACYFCYNWLAHHQTKFKEPATHNKIILACCGPDHDLNQADTIQLIQTYANICQWLNQEIIGVLHSHYAGPQRHLYMSTNGSSVAPSMF